MPSYYLACGEFIAASEASAGAKGIKMKIEFIDHVPDPDGVVALIQAVKCAKGPTLGRLDADYPSGGLGTQDERIWTGERWAIDAPGASRKCPAFGMEFGEARNAWERWKGLAAKSKGRLGRVIRAPNALSFTSAMLKDEPSRAGREAGTAFHHQFESVAMRICGKRDGSGGFILSAKVLGAIRWGYKVSEADAPVLTMDATVATRGPTETWLDAAEKWNSKEDAQSKIPGRREAWAAPPLPRPVAR